MSTFCGLTSKGLGCHPVQFLIFGLKAEKISSAAYSHIIDACTNITCDITHSVSDDRLRRLHLCVIRNGGHVEESL
jgi:hypothetical protein